HGSRRVLHYKFPFNTLIRQKSELFQALIITWNFQSILSRFDIS
ncbi:uncharacterized protein METZ01_LOCUS137507, partial [marine metagenome]